MSEILRSIPGPYFLLLFWGCWYGIHRLMRHLEEPAGPIGLEADPLSLAPRELAMLAQGQDVALLAVVYELLHQGKLVWEDAEQKLLKARRGARTDDPLEAMVLGCAKQPQGIWNLALRVRMDAAGLLQKVRLDLEARGLLVSKEDVRNAWSRAAIPIAALLFCALAKLQMGLERGRPISFLVISLFLGGMLLVLLHRPWDRTRRTRKGNELLTRAQRHVRGMNGDTAEERPHGETMLALGVLGVAALATEPQAVGLHREGWGQGGSQGGGWSSSDSGSSDGGGCGSGGSDGGGDSGGGGGCGGCGGGGD